MAHALHPDVEQVAFLLGTWTGEGRGEYPTIESFAYGEEVRFSHNGKPFLAYTQRTWALDDRRPLHAEMGYLRPRPGGRIELVLAEPTGHVEVAEGTVTGTTIHVATSSIAGAASAKDVTALDRRIEVDGDSLRYVVSMAAVGVSLTPHLRADLVRTPASP